MQVNKLLCKLQIYTGKPEHEQQGAMMVCLCCRCQFLEEKHNKAISRDTWVQLLDFVRVTPTALCIPVSFPSCISDLWGHGVELCTNYGLLHTFADVNS